MDFLDIIVAKDNCATLKNEKKLDWLPVQKFVLYIKVYIISGYKTIYFWRRNEELTMIND